MGHEYYTELSTTAGVPGFVYSTNSLYQPEEPQDCGWDLNGGDIPVPSGGWPYQGWQGVPTPYANSAQSPEQCALSCEAYDGSGNLDFCAGFYWNTKYVGAQVSIAAYTDSVPSFSAQNDGCRTANGGLWDINAGSDPLFGGSTGLHYMHDVSQRFTRAWADTESSNGVAPADDVCGTHNGVVFTGTLFHTAMLDNTLFTNGQGEATFPNLFSAMLAYDPSHRAAKCQKFPNCKGFI